MGVSEGERIRLVTYAHFRPGSEFGMVWRVESCEGGRVRIAVWEMTRKEFYLDGREISTDSRVNPGQMPLWPSLET